MTKKRKNAELGKGSHFETKSVHSGTPPDRVTGARNIPIYQTTSYVFDNVDHASDLFNLQTFGFIYSRLTNPTVAALEERLASLENGRACVAVASGHAAQFLAFFSLMGQNDEFIASKNLYGGSISQFNHSFKRLGWNCKFVDATKTKNIKNAISENTKAIFIEALANPGGIILDIEPIAKIANDAHVPLIVDNTLATPYLFKPIDWGADLVIESTTKFLSGHGTALGGAIIESGNFDWGKDNKFPFITEPDPAYHGLKFFETFGDFAFSMKTRATALRDFGPCLSPANAFYTITGIESLPARMERHVKNATIIAKFLEKHEKVKWVSYAGLPSSPFYTLGKKYFSRGAGAVFTFGLHGGYTAGIKLVERVTLFSHLANLGDTRSLILHPASTTHRQLSEKQMIEAGASSDTIRLSIGQENHIDLISDLEHALKDL